MRAHKSTLNTTARARKRKQDMGPSMRGGELRPIVQLVDFQIHLILGSFFFDRNSARMLTWFSIGSTFGCARAQRLRNFQLRRTLLNRDLNVRDYCLQINYLKIRKMVKIGIQFGLCVMVRYQRLPWKPLELHILSCSVYSITKQCIGFNES